MTLRTALASLVLLTLLGGPATTAHAQTSHATSPAAVKLLHPVFGPWTECDKYVELVRNDMYGSVPSVDNDSITARKFCNIAINSLVVINVSGRLSRNRYFELAFTALADALNFKLATLDDATASPGVIMISEHGTAQEQDDFYSVFNQDLKMSHDEETRFWYYLNHTS